LSSLIQSGHNQRYSPRPCSVRSPTTFGGGQVAIGRADQRQRAFEEQLFATASTFGIELPDVAVADHQVVVRRGAARTNRSRAAVGFYASSIDTIRIRRPRG
jgi:hypothetical protein